MQKKQDERLGPVQALLGPTYSKSSMIQPRSTSTLDKVTRKCMQVEFYDTHNCMKSSIIFVIFERSSLQVLIGPMALTDE